MSLPPSYNLLAEYLNPVYVETGIWKGDSLQQAIDAGFEHVYGIDSDQNCIEECRQRFKDRVMLFHMNSPVALSIMRHKGPVTFYLDAHWQFLEGTEPGPNPFPLLDEIKAIAGREYNDVVIIDDWHIFYPDRVGYSKQDVLDALKAAGYTRFKGVANPVIDGILIAQKC